MVRENFNRYENNKKRKQRKAEKKLRSPVSKGSIRTRDKQSLQRAIDNYEYSEEDDEQL